MTVECCRSVTWTFICRRAECAVPSPCLAHHLQQSLPRHLSGVHGNLCQTWGTGQSIRKSWVSDFPSSRLCVSNVSSPLCVECLFACEWSRWRKDFCAVAHSLQVDVTVCSFLEHLCGAVQIPAQKREGELQAEPIRNAVAVLLLC